MLSDEEVIQAVRLALKQLYDSQALRTNPLVGALGLSDAPNAASELRRILTDAIHALCPSADVPADSGAWRVYEILEFRYLQQAPQSEVAKQLGLSIRHLRREEIKAAEVLAQALTVQRLGRTMDEAAGTPRIDAGGTNEAVSQELAWLDDQEIAQEVDLEDVLAGAVGVARRLAEARGLDVHTTLPDVALRVSVQPVVLREMILELLTAAFCQATDSRVTVSVCPRNSAAAIEIRAPRCGVPPDERTACDAAIAMARQLATRCGAVIEARLDDEAFSAAIVLPIPRQVSVLVIDDNEDAVHLLRRYVAGTPFHILGASSLHQALNIAAHTPPKIIVLDVMMPRVDGWDLLSRLRQHPLTLDAPVVVCSILTQEELAFSLGANDYIRKPVSRHAFLQALERNLRPEATEPPSAPRHSATSPAG